jgi:hypothetical protein
MSVTLHTQHDSLQCPFCESAEAIRRFVGRETERGRHYDVYECRALTCDTRWRVPVEAKGE